VIAALVGCSRTALAAAFDVNDRTWEGCSGLFEIARAELGEARVVALSHIDWSELRPGDAILFLHPDHAVAGDKLAAFLRTGGRIAIVDDFGAGDRMLERFDIERVPPPTRPLSTLRHNPELAIAEPVREPVPGYAAAVHPTVENVERLVTNHPTGFRSKKKLRSVLQIRSIDGDDVDVALAADFDKPPKGKVFAMGDPSALINQMLRYPGNRAFATGLVRYLAQDGDPAVHRGRLLVVANRFFESGAYPGTTSFKTEFDSRIESAGQELRRVLSDGLAGVVGVTLAALVAFGVGVWTTTVSSRMYRRRQPSFTRPVPVVAQGGTAGRIALLSAASTPPSLAVLEVKSALEEGLAQELGLAAGTPAVRLLDEVRRKRALDEPRYRALKDLFLEMSNIETLVAARQPERMKRAEVIRLAREAFDLLGQVRERSRDGRAA